MAIWANASLVAKAIVKCPERREAQALVTPPGNPSADVPLGRAVWLRIGLYRASGLPQVFGDSRRPIRNDWVNEFLLDPLEPLVLMTGPSARHTRPAMRPGDQVVLHAVGHRRVFAAGQIQSGPTWAPDRETRWDPTKVAVDLRVSGRHMGATG